MIALLLLVRVPSLCRRLAPLHMHVGIEPLQDPSVRQEVDELLRPPRLVLS